MAKIHGHTGAIAISANTSPAGSPADNEFVAIGSLSGWTLSFTRPTLESTSLRSVGRSYLLGLADVRGGFDGTFDTDSIQTLMAANGDADGVWIRITPSTVYPDLFFQGSARIDVSISGAVNDAVKVSGQFVGQGVWDQSFGA